MLLRNIIISFCICLVLTFIGASLTRPDSSAFIPALTLQSGAYIVMVIAGLLLHRIFRRKILTFVSTFIVTYALLIFVLWNINGTKTPEAILALHTGRDFFNLLAPFILSNTVLVLWMFFKKSSVDTRKEL